MAFNQQLLADRIKSARGARKLSQAQLGEALGVTGGAVSEWERGLSLPDAPKIVGLCETLNVTPDFLFGYAGDLAVA